MGSHFLTQTALKEQIHYNPVSGSFVWLVSKGPRSKGCHAGCRRPDGYIQITVNLKCYYAHQLAFLYMLGYTPKEIDHDDHNPSNNAWGNLSEKSHSQNQKNLSLSKRNSSGTTGVAWNQLHNKWEAYITSDYKRTHLGLFDHKVAAIAARKAAEKKHGFHENHGVTVCV